MVNRKEFKVNMLSEKSKDKGAGVVQASDIVG